MQNCGEDAKLRERTHSGRLQHTACAGAIAVKHNAETTANRYVRTPIPTATTANIKLASPWLPFQKEPCDIPKPIAQGSSVTFTPTVTVGFGGPAIGAVVFKNGAVVVATETSNTATHNAKFAIAKLTLGSHSITAVYNGKGNFVGSVSPMLKQAVKR